MKVAISFPPFESEKGIPLLSQNRQYQVFTTRDSAGNGLLRVLNNFVGDNATVIFPVLPALAATLLERTGHEAVWLDGIAEGWNWEEYCRQVELARPDLMMIETKTPSALAIYRCIADLKERFPTMKIALVGDHITAFPEEPFLYCPVDFTIRGGQFDFAILGLANHLSRGDDLGGGVFWRDGEHVVNSGIDPSPPVPVEIRPHIDRELVKWKLYARRNGNFLKLGTYGWATGVTDADCWWRRRVPGGPRRGAGGCTFCSWTSMLPVFSVRPVDDYLDELEHLVELGVEEVFDDTGTFPVGRWLRDFCAGFRERGLHKVLMMGCNMRADALNSGRIRDARFGQLPLHPLRNRVSQPADARLAQQGHDRSAAVGLGPLGERGRPGTSRDLHGRLSMGNIRRGAPHRGVHARVFRAWMDQHAARHDRNPLSRNSTLRTGPRERLAEIRRAGELAPI